MRHHELKMRQKHLSWRSMWCKIIFEKSHCFHPVDLVDPFWHPPLWGTSCSLAQPARLFCGLASTKSGRLRVD